MVDISVITVNYKDENDLRSTCLSVDNQSSVPFEHIVIASGYESDDCLRIQNGLKTTYRKFLFNSDSGIYNAMNLGIDIAQGEYIIFLNSGDCFYSRESIFLAQRTISEKNNEVVCFCFASIQIYQEDKYFRPPTRLSRSKKKYGFPHQSFLAPLSPEKAERIHFNESNAISADQEWMQNYVERYDLCVSYIPLSIFSLGGLSSSYSLKSVALHLKTRNYGSALKNIIKNIVVHLIGLRLLYRCLGLINGYARLS